MSIGIVNFTDRVDSLKKAKVLTMAEVLDLIGVSPAMMSMIKSGSRNPSIKTIRRLIEAEREAGILLLNPDGPAVESKTEDQPSVEVKAGNKSYSIADIMERLIAIQKEVAQLTIKIDRMEKKTGKK